MRQMRAFQCSLSPTFSLVDDFEDEFNATWKISRFHLHAFEFRKIALGKEWEDAARTHQISQKFNN